MDHRPNYKMQNSKLLENTVEKLHDLGYGVAFIDKISKIQPMKEITDKLDFNKITNLCPTKDSVKRIR